MALAHGTNYLANHQVAPQIIQGTPNYNVEVAEGQTPPGEWYPAGWLPVVQSENRIAGSGYVLMPGKVVSLDGDKRLVPSGLAVDCKAAQTTPAAGPIQYTALDEQNGFVTKLGAYAVAGTDVATANGFENGLGNDEDTFKFTKPIGIMRYASLMAPGSDPSNPATFTKHAYDTGGSRAFSRYCYIQVPVVEVGARTETAKAGQSNYRIALYSATALTGGIAAFTFKASGFMMTAPAVAGVADQYTIIGRTIMFNDVLAADLTITYTPVVKTPFSCLSVSGSLAGNTLAQVLYNYLGENVSFNVDSNFTTTTTNGVVGRILDIKFGVNDDLKLVRSYYRDFGLWQEQPGSATDGRNTQLSIVNAPTYMARIAINFPGNGL